MKVYTRVPVEEWKKTDPKTGFILTEDGILNFSERSERFFHGHTSNEFFPHYVLIEKDLICFTLDELEKLFMDYNDQRNYSSIFEFLESKGLTKKK